MKTLIGVAAFMTLIASGSSTVVAEDVLRLCVKQAGQVRVVGSTETCGKNESLVEAGGALRFVDADGREIGPWVDLNAVGFPIADPAAGDFWVLARAGRDFYKNVGEVEYDAPDCETGGGARYMPADANAIMRNGIVVEGRLGFTTPTLVYPVNPIQTVRIRSRLLMPSTGTVFCSNLGTGLSMVVGPFASMEVAFTAPFRLIR